MRLNEVVKPKPKQQPAYSLASTVCKRLVIRQIGQQSSSRYLEGEAPVQADRSTNARYG